MREIAVIRIERVDAKKEGTIAVLRRLQLATLEGDRPYDVRCGHWWIAYDGDMPIGFTGVSQSVQWMDTGYLCRAGVLRSHRGKGVQKRLIRVRERKARQLGWAWLVTDTYQNPASSNSLISCGYRMFEPSKPWSFKGALYWRKKVQ